MRQIPSKPPYSILACFVSDVVVNDNNSMIVVNPNSFYSLKYLLAILNSRLMSFWFIHTYGKLQRKVFPQFKVNELRDFPIKVIDFNNSNDVSIHNKLVSYVDNINIADASFTEYNNEIDSLIYKLYGITDDEVKLIESC